jgi:hypothetical protein
MLFSQILVTPEEYATIGFILFNYALFYTAKQMFQFPDERENND